MKLIIKVILIISVSSRLLSGGDDVWHDLFFYNPSGNIGISVRPGMLVLPSQKGEGWTWSSATGPQFRCFWTVASMSAKGTMIEGSCSRNTYLYALNMSSSVTPRDIPALRSYLDIPEELKSSILFGERNISRPFNTVWKGVSSTQSFLILADLLLADVLTVSQSLPPSSLKISEFEKMVAYQRDKFLLCRVEMAKGNMEMVIDDFGVSLRKKDNSGTQILAQEGGDVQNLLSYACAQNPLAPQDAGEINICIRQRVSTEAGGTRMAERQFSARAAPFWNYLLARLMAAEVSPPPALAAAAAPVASPVQSTVEIPATFPAGINTALAATEKAMAAFAETYPALPKPTKCVTHVVRLGETLPAFAQKGELLWQVDMFNPVNGLSCSVWINPQNPLNQGIRGLAADSPANANPWIFILPPIGSEK